MLHRQSVKEHALRVAAMLVLASSLVLGGQASAAWKHCETITTYTVDHITIRGVEFPVLRKTVTVHCWNS